MSDGLLTARQLADRLGVSVSVVYRSRDWPCYKIGNLLRFDEAEVREHIRRREGQVAAS